MQEKPNLKCDYQIHQGKNPLGSEAYPACITGPNSSTDKEFDKRTNSSPNSPAPTTTVPAPKGGYPRDRNGPGG